MAEITLLLPVLDDTPSCAEVDPDAWFVVREPEETDEELAERKAQAKSICNGCLARAGCLEFALTSGQRYGIWGGVDLEEEGRAHRAGIQRAYRERTKEEAAA